jgi:ribose 5-phosphate isomerase
MAQPNYLTTRLVPVAENKLSDPLGLAEKLRQVPGVVEAVIIADESAAYLKVDSKSFDAAIAEAVAGK